ncbi:regulatory protein AsnC-like [Nilaparvata lugens]|uniref:regulatory protein AsnC-like n=1 Tax=Nilaparvata lugens TaxID=108931 RepID=UPI00193D782C|nr:regulatory protein AsnC-like [Nilaparvata lugens]
MDNARTPYAELAKNFAVSPGTISCAGREDETGRIITGARSIVSPKQLGYDVCCFIGIILKSAKDYPSALKKLESLEEVVEAYYTTGPTASLSRCCRSIDARQQVLINKIQTIDEIQSTETLISLQNPISAPSCRTRQIAYHHMIHRYIPADSQRTMQPL